MDPRDVVARDRAHVWHPYTQHATAPEPVAIARAQGAYLFDHDGRPILDAISSWWVTLHGHAHPAIAAAVAEQAARLEQVIFAGFTHEPAARLASELARITPGDLSRVFFSDNGSTAVEVAIKMALQFWRNAGRNRPGIVALEHAYHGDTFGAMSTSGRGLFTAPFADLMFDVHRLPDPATHDVGADLARLCEERGPEIGAVIVEPMLQGASGMRVWSADALAAIRRVASEHDILLIADEVLTGFGRTGPLFACEHAGVVPDIMCLSKGLTGGFLPMGATVTTERVFEAFLANDDATRTLYHGHSYTANPIACAAANASIALLDEECAARRDVIHAAHTEFADRVRTSNSVRNVRVLGTILAMELASSDDGYLNPVGKDLHRFALDRGVLLRPLGNTVYVLPPYCADPSDLSRAYSVILDFLAR